MIGLFPAPTQQRNSNKPKAKVSILQPLEPGKDSALLTTLEYKKKSL